MGLILNNLSGSKHGKQLTGGGGVRSFMAATGAFGFLPYAPGTTSPDGHVVPVRNIFEANKDSSFIVSGTVGGRDKALFMGDVVISGSLSAAGGGMVSSNAGAEGQRRIAFYNDNTGDVITGDADLLFPAAGAAFGPAGSDYDGKSFEHGGIELGAVAGNDVSINLAAGDLVLFTGETADTTEKAGIFVGATQQLAITGSGGPGAAGPERVSTVLGGANSVIIGAGTNHASAATQGDVRLISTGITGSALNSGFQFVGAKSSTLLAQDGFLSINATGTTNGEDGVQVTGNDIAITSTRGTTGGLIIGAHGSGDVDLQVGTNSVLKVDSNSIDAAQDIVLDGAKTINGGDQSRILFAGMNGDDVDLSLGAGANVVMGGDLKLSSGGRIEDSNGDARITAAHGSNTLIAGDSGTTVVTVADASVTVAQPLDCSGKLEVLDVTDAASSGDDSASIHTDGGVAIAKSAFVGGNLTVSGDFEVNGVQTTIDTQHLQVEDPIIALGKLSGSLASAGDRGIVFATNAAPNGSPVFFWNNSGVTNGTPEGTFEFVLANASGSEASISPLGTNGSSHLDIQAGGAVLKDITLNKADSAGDVDIKFQQGGTTAFSMGIDDTDGSWKLHSDAAIANTSDVKLAANGVLSVVSLIADSADINAGFIDNTAIGNANPAAGSFTSLGASGQSDLAGIVNLAASGVATTVKGSLSVEEAATFDTTVGITGDLTVSGGAGAITFGGGSSSIVVTDNVAAGLDIGAVGATDMLRFDTTNDSEQLIIGKKLVPKADNSIDLGSSDLRFANIYTGDLNLRNDRGDWTLIEEEDFISFRNNRSGRRFRMVMEDITGTGTYGPGNDGEM